MILYIYIYIAPSTAQGHLRAFQGKKTESNITLFSKKNEEKKKGNALVY